MSTEMPMPSSITAKEDYRRCRPHHKERLGASAVNALATLESITSPRSKSLQEKDDNDNNDPSDPLFSQASYKTRVQSFQTRTYFAKPTELSPLVCARFGWENVAPNLLMCCACHEAIYVDFHPKLSDDATQSLLSTYLGMLATTHADSCIFRNDAERWLLSLEKEKGHKEESECYDSRCFVPPYLLPMSDEFLLFMDTSASSSFVKESVKHAALNLCRAMVGTTKWWNVEVPKDVLFFFSNTFQGMGTEDEMETGLVHCILECLQPNEIEVDFTKEDAWIMPHRLKSTDSENNAASSGVEKDAVLLATFGWRTNIATTEATTASSFDGAVTCHICLANARISRRDDTDRTDQTALLKFGSDGEVSNDHDNVQLNNVHDSVDSSGTLTDATEQKAEAIFEATTKNNMRVDSKNEVGRSDQQNTKTPCSRKRARIPDGENYYAALMWDSSSGEEDDEEEMDGDFPIKALTEKRANEGDCLPPPPKRRRLLAGEETFIAASIGRKSSNNNNAKDDRIPLNADLHLLHSHRHFCPYVMNKALCRTTEMKTTDALETNHNNDKKVVTQSGWQFILTHVCEKGLTREGTADGTKLFHPRKKAENENTYLAVQQVLQSAVSATIVK